jgi:muramoyltetrapeptide carboxypeptidase
VGGGGTEPIDARAVSTANPATGRPEAGVRRPFRLRPGDLVAVIAPAGPPDPARLRAGVSILQAWGLRVRLGGHLLDRHPALPYLAGEDPARAADLAHAWCDPEVAAVFCARGGYGCTRLTGHLDLAALREQAGRERPPLLVGSSDVTVLHELITRPAGLVSLFGPMVATSLAHDRAARAHLRRTLFEPESVMSLRRPGAGPLVTGGADGAPVSGELTGGNASLLAALGPGRRCAPGGERPAGGGLVVLEDVGEVPYRLDGILTRLLAHGRFDGAAGIVLGSWKDCGSPEAVRAVLADRLGGLGVPVLHELGFGHCEGQLTVPLGMPAELDVVAGELRPAGPALR